MRALLLAMLIAGSGCTNAPVKPVPVHYTAAIFFHTCGLVTAIELVNSEGVFVYLDWYKTPDDEFDAAVQEANKLNAAVVDDIQVIRHCMLT